MLHLQVIILFRNLYICEVQKRPIIPLLLCSAYLLFRLLSVFCLEEHDLVQSKPSESCISAGNMNVVGTYFNTIVKSR